MRLQSIELFRPYGFVGLGFAEPRGFGFRA